MPPTKLKLMIDSLDEVDENYREFYEQHKDGGFILSTEGDDFKKRIDDFRSNNISLTKRNEELEKKFKELENVDPEKYQEMKKQLEELEEKNLIEQGKVDELLEARTERMRKEIEEKSKILEERAKKAEERLAQTQDTLNTMRINDSVIKAASEVAVVKSGAIPDLLSRATQTWNVDEEGNMVAKNLDGTTIYSTDGESPIGMVEWLKGLYKEADHLFEKNSGGEAPGSGQPRPGVKIIGWEDKSGYSKNLEEIAKGNVEVQ